ncbi:MAG: 2-amino-4-hydroxy-6-hydroxymethyldihydropteridine diphosphokinase [Pseudomonadota bacterium]
MTDQQAQGIDGTTYAKAALIAVGANLPGAAGSPAQAVAASMQHLAQIAGPDCAPSFSRLYETPAYPPGSDPKFVNAAMRLDWSGTAASLLSCLNDVEETFGRTRNRRWEARIMDLDLIAFGQDVLPDLATQTRWANLSPQEAARQTPADLIVPHPRLAERAFVLVPLAEIAPDWRHPVTGLSVIEMRDARPQAELEDIRALSADGATTGSCHFEG